MKNSIKKLSVPKLVIGASTIVVVIVIFLIVTSGGHGHTH